MTEEQRAMMALEALRAIGEVMDSCTRSSRRKTEPTEPIQHQKYDIKMMRDLGTSACAECGGELEFSMWEEIGGDSSMTPTGSFATEVNIRCPECGVMNGDYMSRDEFNRCSGGTKWAVKVKR